MNIKEMSQDAEKVVVRFDVLDTGCGISADGLSRLFQPFSQADASTARRFGGTGLGLSISKNLVELMDGKITLESVEGQGSHASFEIPFRKTQRRDRNAEGTSSKKSSVRRSSPSGVCKEAAATTTAAAKVEENKDVDMSQSDFHENVSHKENVKIGRAHV